MATSAGWNETTVELAGVKLHLLGGVRASALVVWGDDDKVVPRSAGQRYAALLPKARIEIVSAAGHCVDMDMEQPAEPDRLVGGVIEENRLIDRVSTGPRRNRVHVSPCRILWRMRARRPRRTARARCR